MYDLPDIELVKLDDYQLFDMVLLECSIRNSSSKPIITLAAELGMEVRTLYNVRNRKSTLPFDQWLKIAGSYEVVARYIKARIRK